MSKESYLRQCAELGDAAMDLFLRMSPEVSRRERDKGIAKVSLNNDGFMSRALNQLGEWKSNWILHGGDSNFTGEDIRIWLGAVDIIPAHSNALGALTMQAIRRGIIVPTGRYISMKSRSSHARKTAVYKWA